MHEFISKKYPDAISREFGEGGYTFLHRAFRNNIQTGKPTIINTGNVFLSIVMILSTPPFLKD